jgi:type IV pilus assembly protein PilY1
MKTIRVPEKKRYLLLALLLVSLVAPPALQAGMNDYCIMPPYVVQNVPPNVMIVVDTSGSMFNFAYSDGFNTTTTSDDNNCTSGSSCSGFTNPGTYPTYKYYGYFDPDQWYTYASSKFSAAGAKSGTRPSLSWDGNWLNWLFMRRVDIVRKVLTGGKKTGTNQLDTEVADCDSRGNTKTASNASLYTPFSGSRTFTVNSADAGCGGGGSGVSSVTVSGTAISGYPTTFTGSVVVPVPVTGVLQDTVGARARIGLTFYNVNEAGKVWDNISGTSLNSVVSHINTTRPFTNTPLAETLWTVTGDFAQRASMLSGPGPRYASGDFTVSTSSPAHYAADPWNYGTDTVPRWPVCAKSFVLYITDGEPCADGNLPASLADYAGGRSAFNCNGGSCPSVAKPNGGSFPASTFPSCTAGGYTAGIEDVALYMHTTDLRSSTLGLNNISGTQNLTLYTIFAFGKGSTLLRYAAINGGFTDNGSHVPSPQSTWDSNNDGDPDNFYEAFDGAELENAARDAFSGILKRASSGTAASVLASGEGSGANLVQAVFYPRRPFGDDIVWWTGTLQNMWYFVDPFFSNATIREETTADSKLNLTNDYIAQFYFDNVTELTKVKRWVDSNGDGVADGTASTVNFENLGNLWEAGNRLWLRNLGTAPRTIYTTLNGSSLTNFDDAATIGPYLIPDAGDNVTTIIKYVLGMDNTSDVNLRSRTVQQGATTGVWKLGDIIDSTPRIVSSIPLNKYDQIYGDTTYKSFIDNTNYKNRGMVFTGGNDGMLHAFRLGKLELTWTGKTAAEKARLSAIGSTTMGDEAWGFIPRNALPYLKYLKDPDYCHLYYVDLSPYVFDASIGSGSGDQSTQPRTQLSWRTVLVGGMRYGGACSNTCTSGQDCVKTPATDNGYSSYFAMDVTDPESPSLLWEFSNAALGFATTGPAIFRTNAVNTSTHERDRTLNGEWHVVVGSGPTGPIDNTNNQFLGRSNQNLKFFVLNLKTGALVQTIDSGIQYAFGGSMINAVADFNLDYQDDAVYVGYVERAGTSPSYTWTDGGIGRIFTKNVTPNNSTGWVFSHVIDGIGPVTSSIARLQNQNFDMNWLYAGTGRYFFENPPTAIDPSPVIDDADGQRRLVAVKEPCFFGGTVNSACTTTVVFPTSTDTNFPNVTSIANVPAEGTANLAGFKGWYINLDASGSFSYDNAAARSFRAERVITDPLATTSGIVFFTTYKPYAEECALGGKSFLWALRYNTGAAPLAGVMKGKALVKVSTASVEQLDLATAFQKAAGEGAGGLHKDGRRTAAIEGVPPTAQGLSLLSQPPPVKRIMHMMER